MVRLTDVEIGDLISEPKILPSNWRIYLKLREKYGHDERNLDVSGRDRGEFRLIFRQSLKNKLDFCVALCYRLPNTNILFRLRRYNGKHSRHTNHIEGDCFYDFHIHTATERYQLSGEDEDSFAEPTGRFSNFKGAVDCLVKDCLLILPPESQLSLPTMGN